jgi:hypothetical protein
VSHEARNLRSPEGRPERVRARTGFVFRPVNLLLLFPFVGLLIPAFYNRVTPRLGGVPFFYWYQLVWIPISVVITLIVYRATRGDR